MTIRELKKTLNWHWAVQYYDEWGNHDIIIPPNAGTKAYNEFLKLKVTQIIPTLNASEMKVYINTVK